MYRIFLVITSILLVLVSYYNYQLSVTLKPNYLYIGSLNLDQHAISNPIKSDQTKIIFLGSSAVAGSNIPPRTTTSDYFEAESNRIKSYNLATMEATLLDSLVYFEQSLKYSPKVAFLGLNPGSFPLLPSNRLIWNNREFSKKFLSKKLIEAIDHNRLKKADFKYFIDKKRPKSLPSLILLEYKTALFHARNKLFGPVFSHLLFGAAGQSLDHVLDPKNELVGVLGKIGEHFKKKGVRLIIYLEPITFPHRVYGEKSFERYLSLMKEVLTNQGIEFYDYTNLLPNTNIYFSDFIHLTPEGNQLVAKNLFKDTGASLK